MESLAQLKPAFAALADHPLDEVGTTFRSEMHRAYPDLEIGLDANELGILRHTASGSEFFYGSVALGALAPGESASFPVRYIINDPLPLGPDLVPPEGPDLVLPRLLLLGVVVPEPGTAALLATGLAALAARRRGGRWA